MTAAYRSSVVPGRGVVQETRLEFEIVLPDGQLFFDSRSRYLFTKHKAERIVSACGGKMWWMEHTPASSPRSFDPFQLALFKAGRCSYITDPSARSVERYCGKQVAPRADYGYCTEHKGQLLAACPSYARPRVRICSHLMACFHEGLPVPSTVR